MGKNYSKWCEHSAWYTAAMEQMVAIMIVSEPKEVLDLELK